MSGNALKTPLSKSFPEAVQKKILDAMQLFGKSLPCHVVSVSGAIVTVAFDITSDFTLPNVTVPLFGPEYIRYPIQDGDKGVVFAADARLGGVSGLGSGVSDLSQPANLTALVFFPIANKTWGAVDPESVTIYGPNGVVLRDTGSATTMTLTPDGIAIICQDSFTISTGLCSFSLAASGAYSLMGAIGNLNATTSVNIAAPTVSISDGIAHTSPTIMNAAWSALVTWLNTHTHTSNISGSPTSTPIAPFTGGSIAP